MLGKRRSRRSGFGWRGKLLTGFSVARREASRRGVVAAPGKPALEIGERARAEAALSVAAAILAACRRLAGGERRGQGPVGGRALGGKGAPGRGRRGGC